MNAQNEFDAKTSEELLMEYKRTKDHRIKQELVLRYVYIVRNVAVQMRGVYLSFSQIDDMINEGVIAIMSSIEKFDVDKKIKFETYVSKRIRGLIIDIARKQDWVPRSVRKNAKDIDDANNALYSDLGRFPNDEEVAAYMHMSIDKYKESLIKTNVHNLLSLDKLMEEDVNRKSEQILSNSVESSPENYLQNRETTAILGEGLSRLRDNEQMVVSLYYVKELSMKEIASVLDVSEPRISQIHASAIRKLRLFMGKALDEK